MFINFSKNELKKNLTCLLWLSLHTQGHSLLGNDLSYRVHFGTARTSAHRRGCRLPAHTHPLGIIVHSKPNEQQLYKTACPRALFRSVKVG